METLGLLGLTEAIAKRGKCGHLARIIHERGG